MKKPLSAFHRPPSTTRVLLGFLFLFLYVPFLWMVWSSVQTGAGWGLDWYFEVLRNSNWMGALERSFLIALCSSLFATTLAFGAALITRGWVAGALNLFSILALVLPELVFALSLLSWFVFVGLQLSLWTVLIAHVTFSLSLSYFLILSRIRQIDPLLFEAAADLGAGAASQIGRLYLPLVAPSLVASFLVCFLLSFDDFLISFFVSGVGSDTLPIQLFSAMKVGLTPQLHALASMMSLASGFIMYFVVRLLYRKS